MIIVGLGSGRCGTTSLAGLIDRQPSSACFHEMNVSSIGYQGTFRPVENTIEEFAQILSGGTKDRLTIDRTDKDVLATYKALQNRGSLKAIGDVASYYLYYVDQLAEMPQDIRFVCLKRDREGVVRSWIAKNKLRRTPVQTLTGRLKAGLRRRNYISSANLLQNHDGTRWRVNRKWDKCFPKFDSGTLEDSIRQYWDHYYERAESYQTSMPETFRIFDMQDLNTDQGRSEILRFCGFGGDNMISEAVHLNESSLKRPRKG